MSIAIEAIAKHLVATELFYLGLMLGPAERWESKRCIMGERKTYLGILGSVVLGNTVARG